MRTAASAWRRCGARCRLRRPATSRRPRSSQPFRSLECQERGSPTSAPPSSAPASSAPSTSRQLRRIGVQVRGVLGSTPERGAARAEALGVGARLPVARRHPRRSRVDVVHVTSPNHLHVAQAQAILAAGRHVVCEKPLAMTADGVGRARRARPPSGLVNASTSTSASTRSTSTPASSSPTAASATSGFVTGHYFQDWLLLDTDWNWRLEPDKGGSLRAVGDIGSHWLDLVDVHDRPADRRGHGRPRDVRRTRRRAARVPSRRSRRIAPRTPSRAPIATEDAASILLRFESGARGAVAHLPDQRRPEELAPVGDRRLRRRPRPGTRRRPTTSGSATAIGRTRSCSGTRR